MTLRGGVFAIVAGQLAKPSGLVGRGLGRVLNRANSRLATAAVESTAVERGDEVVDIGFGGGTELALLLGRVGESGAVHGVEISDVMLAGSRRKFRNQIASGRLRLHEARMERLPMPDGSVDVVMSTNTVYFVDDLGVALAEVQRVLRSGGRLVLGLDDPDDMAARPFTKYGFILRPIDEIAAFVHEAGFSLVESHRLGGRSGSWVIVGVKPS